MKKITLIVSLINLFLVSCNSDIEVITDWKETNVIYGLLDASKDTQYVKINKVFLGEGDAYEMAQFPDSINLNPSEMLVYLHKINFQDTILSVILDTTLMTKDSLQSNGSDPGFFSSDYDQNIIYRAVTPPDFFSNNFDYAISVENIRTGNVSYSVTEVINDFSFLNFNSNFKFGFYNPSLPDSLRFLNKTIEWQKVKNGHIYQLDIKFNYFENGILKNLIWSQDLEEFSGANIMQSKLEGDRFFNFLRTRLIKDDGIFRIFAGIDLVMTVGTEDLNTYIQVNEPLSTINQQRPQFTNIQNGLGLFSSRFTYSVNNLDLTFDTRNYLIDELDRNFQ